MLLLHMGALHPVEKWLTIVLAVGPFVILWVALRIAKRRDAGARDQQNPTAAQTASAAQADEVSAPPPGP